MTGTRSGTDCDVVVVGLGALGSATAWQLARRGVSVVGLERFELGHVRGASHGDSRIIRLSYHTPTYVRNAREAYADWAELEADAGRALLLPTGGVDVYPVGAAIDPADYLAAMDAESVVYQAMDAAESRYRWPALAVPDDALVVFQEQTGIAPADAGTAAMRDRAAAHGAGLRAGCRVRELTDLGDAVRVRLDDGTALTAGSVVVTADAWTNEALAGLDHRVPLTVTKEHVIHYDVSGQAEQAHSPGRFPVWIWMDEPSYYGFPCFGEASVKVGQDCGGDPVDPETRTFDPEPGYVGRMTDFVHRTIPGTGAITRVTTCLYTLPPDRDFVAAAVPGHERVVVGLGAAHGFKYAPWFGRVLADLATTGGTTSDVAPFALDRPGLTDPAAPVTWLV
jgi:sarcosine oxidase